MNRLGKILTLGLERKRAWQLPIIAGLLMVFGLGVRWWYNSRAAQGIRLLDMVDINDLDGVRWVLRWDSKQKDRPGKLLENYISSEEIFQLGMETEVIITDWSYEAGLLEYTPLRLAVERQRTDIVKLLIASGADFKSADTTGATFLHLAAELGNQALLELLVANGARLNVCDHDERTPLAHAIKAGNEQAANWLLGKGAGFKDAEINNGLQLVVSTEKYFVKVGDNVETTGTLHNRGRKPIYTCFRVRRYDRTLIAEYYLDPPTFPRTTVARGCGPMRCRKIEPGKTWSLPFSFDPDTPGAYEISHSWESRSPSDHKTECWRGEISSNKIVVYVMPKDGKPRRWRRRRPVDDAIEREKPEDKQEW